MDILEAIAVLMVFIQYHQMEWALACLGLFVLGGRLEALGE